MIKLCKGFGIGFFVVVALFAVISLFTAGFLSFLTLLLSAFTVGVPFYVLGEVLEHLEVLNHNVHAIYRLVQQPKEQTKDSAETPSLSELAAKIAPLQKNADGTWNCQNCGTANESNAPFCKDCGTYK